MVTADEIRAFEADIAAEFNAGRIRAPIHLDGGNEATLVEIFKDFRPGDWCLTSWRSHAKALLAGAPPEVLKAEIMAGRSIAVCLPKYRVLSSAIAGGQLPIALGIAWQIKRAEGSETVWCFLGDMVAEMGLFHECVKYAEGFSLPVRWVIEDNGKSVCTDTPAAWGGCSWLSEAMDDWGVKAFGYDLPWPHAGAGVRVQF